MDAAGGAGALGALGTDDSPNEAMSINCGLRFEDFHALWLF